VYNNPDGGFSPRQRLIRVEFPICIFKYIVSLKNNSIIIKSINLSHFWDFIYKFVIQHNRLKIIQ
jgi:hypothetical protein